MNHRIGFYNLMTNTKYANIADDIIKLYDMTTEALDCTPKANTLEVKDE